MNLRAGPGTQYPVEWIFRRRGLPVEVIAEFRNWRKVRDWEGVQGWIHQSMLSGRRTAIVIGDVAVLMSSAGRDSVPVASAEAGVVGKILECPAQGDACRVAMGSYDGWLARDVLWGVYEGEAVR